MIDTSCKVIELIIFLNLMVQKKNSTLILKDIKNEEKHKNNEEINSIF